MRRTRLLALLLLAAAAAPGAAAQGAPPAADSTALVRIDLLDGSSFVGVVVREDAREVELRTQSGAVVTIPRAQIRRRAPFEGRVDGGRMVRFDPNRTRLLFSPTARALRSGQGYLAVYELFVPFVAVGVSDAFSLAGGTLLFPGAFGRVFYVAPKLTLVERPDLAVALGGIGLGVFIGDVFESDGDDWGTAGIGYGLVTYGGPERSLTAGVGVAIAEGGFESGAILTLGGEWQLSNSVKLLSENYLLPFEEHVVVYENGGSTQEERRMRYEALISFGVRFFGERIAVDLAGWTSPELLDDDVFPFFPWVGFAYNFGR